MDTVQISWNSATLFAYLSIGLIVATYLRKQIPFLQKLLIPNAIIAGVIVLILSQKVINLINIPAGSINTLVYHLLTGALSPWGCSKERGKTIAALLLQPRLPLSMPSSVLSG